MQQQQCALVLLFAFNQIVQTMLQGIPTSPCPKLFQYRFDGRQWFGMISLKNHDHEQTLYLRVTLSLVGKPKTNYLGEIEMLTRDQLNEKDPILYRIKFPKANFPPRLLKITINGQVVCLGPTDHSIFVTKIKLEHTRKYTFVPSGVREQPIAPVYHAQDNQESMLDDFSSADDLMPKTDKQLKNPPLTRFDSPMLVTKDLCGTIDNRIRFQFTKATKRSSGNGKTLINKFRNSAGDILSQKKTAIGSIGVKSDETEKETETETDTEENYNINKSGANVPPVPLVTSEFLDPLNDDTDSMATASSSFAAELLSITRGAWPWLAAIYVNNLTSLAYQCGGTLISARIVLTSAHCFKMFQKSYTANEVLVFLGRHNLKNWSEEGSIAAPVDDIFLHPDFDSHLNTYDADIAVLVLKNIVRFNAFIRPACLWSGPTNTEFIEGERGIVVGWGISSSGIKKPSAFQTTTAYNNVVARAVDAPIVSNDICYKANEQYRSLTSNRTFCAGSVTSDESVSKPKLKIQSKMISKNQRTYKSGPCTGDSGAGLLLLKNNRWMLRGMVSASIPLSGSVHEESHSASPSKTDSSIDLGCNHNQYVIYTDVAKFLDWIYAFII